MQRPAGWPGSGWRPVVDLALISFASLYLEMLVIRWLASDIRVFAYFKNLPLLAAFLGLGVGLAHRDGRWFSRLPILCFAFAMLVAFAGPLDLVHLYIPQQDDLKFFADFSAHVGRPVPLLVAKFLVVVLGMFFLVVALFAGLGERLGAQFDAMPPLRAYSVNLIASLAGIWVFAALSWLGWPPAGWLALGLLVLVRFVWSDQAPRARLLALGLFAGTVAVVAAAPGATRWSPYYRVDLTPATVTPPGGEPTPVGYLLAVNHDVFQFGFNLSEAFVRAHPSDELDARQREYDRPYRFAQPRRVLVVGAGMGNDVAAAVRNGAERVDAVEIDPVIVELGRQLHPERPYASPRVRVIVDDARSVFARSDEQYDMIVFGQLDSHTLLSSMSSLRLDSYVYTVEALEHARRRLAPGGHVALSFAESTSSDYAWLPARLYQMLTAVFGEEPVTLSDPNSGVTLHMVGPGVRERLAADPQLAALTVDPALLREPVLKATDDWPFLYLRTRGVALLPYGAMLVLVLLAGIAVVRRAARGSGRGLDPTMVLLGAGFMLVEVKSISQLSLLFGSTWLVNALIISAILILALLANLYVGARHPSRLGPAYAPLAAALIADYLLPLGALNQQPLVVKTVLGSLLPVLPILFAGVVFATLFSRTTAPAHALGSNLLGALAGGLLEYVSMATGFKALGVIALALYAASWLTLRGSASLVRAPEPASEPQRSSVPT
jgi:hypothetical protein